MSKLNNQLQRAKEIVERYVERGCIIPRELRDCGRSDPAKQQGINLIFNINYIFFKTKVTDFL